MVMGTLLVLAHSQVPTAATLQVHLTHNQHMVTGTQAQAHTPITLLPSLSTQKLHSAGANMRAASMVLHLSLRPRTPIHTQIHSTLGPHMGGSKGASREVQQRGIRGWPGWLHTWGCTC
jgi:hypothetical protein